MNFKEVKKKLGLSNSDIAKMYGYKNTNSYVNSSKKHIIENAITQTYLKTIEAIKKCLS